MLRWMWGPPAQSAWITLTLWLGLWARLFSCTCECVRSLWICTVTMHHRGRKSRSLCVSVSVTWKAGETKGWADKADQRTGLEKADKADATLPLMSSSTPSVKVNSRFLNPLLVLSAGVTRHVISSVYQCPPAHRLRLAEAQSATCSSWPSDTGSNLATQIMLSRQRGDGSHMISGALTLARL